MFEANLFGSKTIWAATAPVASGLDSTHMISGNFGQLS